MLTGEIRNQIDRIWDAFWSGGISNPLEVIEQITYLLSQAPGRTGDGRGTEGEPGKSLRSKTYLCRGSEKCRNNMAPADLVSA
jgi:hypothetical protein